MDRNNEDDPELRAPGRHAAMLDQNGETVKVEPLAVIE
jgi:hypothetical protein